MAGVEDQSGSKGSPDDIAAQAEAAPDLTAAAVDVIPPEIVAQSLSQYFRAWFARVKSGDAGVLPVVAALVIVTIVFQIVSPNHVYLRPVNLVNLFDQSAVFIILASRRDLRPAAGRDRPFDRLRRRDRRHRGRPPGTTPVGSVRLSPQLALVGSHHRRAADLRAIGAIHGLIITRLRLPSFVVTLAGQMFWFGVMIIILGQAGGLSVTSTILPDQRAVYGIVYALLERLAQLGRPGRHRRAHRRVDVAARLQPASQRPGGAARGSDSRQDRLHRGRRHRRRGHLQRRPQPGDAADHRRAVGRARSSSPWSEGRRSCSSGPSSGATCTPSAATQRRPGAPASA